MAPLCLDRLMYRCYCTDRTFDVSPLKTEWRIHRGVCMRMMHLCYAAIGFAVARWVFKRQRVALADPVVKFRASGLL